MNRKRIALSALLSLLFLALLIGCGKKEENTEQSTSPSGGAAAPAATIDKSQAASVSGTVKLDGTAPKPTKIDMSQDPACKKGGDNMTETVVTDDKNDLANVFVYVKDGLPNATFEVPKDAVVIDQSGCRYHPHVLGVMAGQTISIKNDDQTTHNIHPSPKDNKEWNESQPPGAAPLEKSFARQEVMIPVKCNQHPWMKMYIGVVKNPYFAVTDKDGKYTIKDLPPGEYTLTAIQPDKGWTQDLKIKVEPKKDMTDQNFTLKAGAAAGGMQ
jgi:plastocyanin